MFNKKVEEFIEWVNNFTEDELFIEGGRKWTSCTIEHKVRTNLYKMPKWSFL
ncbi:hypothetical protein CNEO3_290038 [Clostridium neonatale]|nr:hypothetical protein CNEO3_290038 [Clostridium neonatale]